MKKIITLSLAFVLGLFVAAAMQPDAGESVHSVDPTPEVILLAQVD